eukprot:1234763-Rhodomonas_salina.1
MRVLSTFMWLGPVTQRSFSIVAERPRDIRGLPQRRENHDHPRKQTWRDMLPSSSFIIRVGQLPASGAELSTTRFNDKCVSGVAAST